MAPARIRGRGVGIALDRKRLARNPTRRANCPLQDSRSNATSENDPPSSVDYLSSPSLFPVVGLFYFAATMLSALGNPRQTLMQVLNFALVLSTAFMLWKGLSVVTDSPSPIVVVLSGSMEPAFQRGDLLFLWNRGQDTQIGEIVVYNVKGKDIPIVHRVVRRYGGG